MTTPPESPSPDRSPDRITPAKSTEADQTIRQPPGGVGFESHMQRGAKPATEAGAPTPMEAARPSAMQAASPTVNTLLAQANTAQDSLGIVRQQLKTPNLKLKRSQAHLLKNKLTDAQTYSRAVAAKLGVETAAANPSTGGILERFLGYVGDGQNQMEAVQSKLQEMASSNQQLSAADMMLIQAKMNIAQQEIEFSSTLLSKVISSITTIMGIQL